ncbi:hypothetical protein [Streptomyces sp. NPDC085529]|uniref:hypothetical protein n=1 Tax=Streptomyces sp. NPDC085529 TaxID=3365729 RepID=UPI0037CDF513
METFAPRREAVIREESRSLAEPHVDAMAEGGTLTVHAGGDIPDRQDYTADGFRQAFPDIEINMIVDYGKYHDVRIDRQPDEGRLVPDVTPPRPPGSTSTGCSHPNGRPPVSTAGAYAPTSPPPGRGSGRSPTPTPASSSTSWPTAPPSNAGARP